MPFKLDGNVWTGESGSSPLRTPLVGSSHELSTSKVMLDCDPEIPVFAAPWKQRGVLADNIQGP